MGDKTKRRINRVYKLYMGLGSYQAVGDKLGLTNERIRQLIKQGDDMGLFTFQIRSKENLQFLKSAAGKTKILGLYNRGYSLTKIAKKLRFGNYVHMILQHHGMYGKSWDKSLRDKRKAKCLSAYLKLKSKLGVFPNTTCLQRVCGKLDSRILRTFGSFRNFCNYAGLKTNKSGKILGREVKK